MPRPMANSKPRISGVLAGEQRTNIRMSKLARVLQTSAAKTNWSETVKMLFRADPSGGRNDEIGKMISIGLGSNKGDDVAASYSIDQLQYLLFLMLVISIAEKRTQDIYGQDFSQRCDAISKRYGLKDDEYWPDGGEPAEWKELNQEFEKRSLEILLETLSEYHHQEIASMIESEGLEEFFQIIKSIRTQFLRMLKTSEPGRMLRLSTESGSIPETLNSARVKEKSSDNKQSQRVDGHGEGEKKKPAKDATRDSAVK